MNHVIIVGAGICGLSIARKLLERGKLVTLVEARDRIGGRIHTLHGPFSRPTEQGAEFVHGQQPITMGLLKEAGGHEIKRSGIHYRLADDVLQEGDVMDEQWNTFFTKLGALKSDVTLESFLQQHFSGAEFDNLRRGVKGFAEGFDIADTQRVSALALREEWSHTDEEDQHHVKGGYQILIDFLEKKIREHGGVIHLSTPVQSIKWKSGNVTVVASGRIIDGDEVVITVPLGVLQHGDITFDPPIQRHQKAIDSMGYGGVIKFLFEFKVKFWETSPRSLRNASFIFSDAEVPTWWTQHPESSTLITGWLGGPSTLKTDDDTNKLFDKAVRSLEYITNCSAGEIRSQLKHWHIVNWVSDPFSRGAYSFPTIETKRAVSFLSLPIDNTIHFGGEAIYDGSSGGTVEAALASAEIVAEKLLAKKTNVSPDTI
ncbi:MAG: NAD(P)/FAD-dependent oxidoreductase [Chryseolinea sp.]